MIIDVSSTIPTQDFLLSDILALKGTGYIKVFGPAFAKWAGISQTEIDELLGVGDDVFINRIIEQAESSGVASLSSFISALDQAGVQRSALHNMDEETTTGNKPVPNDNVAEVVAQYPDRFIGFAGVDPHKGQAAVKELERAVTKLGLQGLVLRPYAHKIYASDKKYYPIYSKCVELGIPIWIHTSFNWSLDVTIDFGRPIYLDQVACDFPDLRLIGGHGGWPWVNEMIAVVWRHNNVYMDFSTFRPRYLGKRGSGWDMLLHFGNNVIQDKVLFGSDWLSMGIPIEQVIREVQELPLRDEVKEKWLGRNAACLFGLEEERLSD
jgi:predicted TIM-barrel fold metal-dependent hydrolase